MGRTGPVAAGAYSILDQDPGVSTIAKTIGRRWFMDKTDADKSASATAASDVGAFHGRESSQTMKPSRTAVPQWPPQLVDAVQNHLALLFSQNAGGSESSSLSSEEDSITSSECSVESATDMLRLQEQMGESELSGCSSSCLSESGDDVREEIGDECRPDDEASKGMDVQPLKANRERSDGFLATRDLNAALSAAILEGIRARDYTSLKVDRHKRKGSPVTPYHGWMERMTYWRSRSDDEWIGAGPQIELDSRPLPCGWEQILNLKTGKIFYENEETCERTSADPRKRMRMDDRLRGPACERQQEDSISDTTVEGSS